MEYPRGKVANGASTMVKTKHSRWRREPRKDVLSYTLCIARLVNNCSTQIVIQKKVQGFKIEMKANPTIQDKSFIDKTSIGLLN